MKTIKEILPDLIDFIGFDEVQYYTLKFKDYIEFEISEMYDKSNFYFYDNNDNFLFFMIDDIIYNKTEFFEI
jgi:hypothetical protein